MKEAFPACPVPGTCFSVGSRGSRVFSAAPPDFSTHREGDCEAGVHQCAGPFSLPMGAGGVQQQESNTQVHCQRQPQHR